MRNQKFKKGSRKLKWKYIFLFLIFLAVIPLNIKVSFAEEVFLNPQQKKAQIPQEKLKTMSTEELLNEVLTTSMGYLLVAYSTPQQGFEQFRKKFNGLDEFMRRENAGEVALQKYIGLEVFDIPKDKKGEYSLTFLRLEIILSQPEIMEQLKGKEKTIIKEGLNKIEERVRYRKKDDSVYSLASMEYTALMLGKILLENKFSDMEQWLSDKNNRTAFECAILSEEQFWAIVSMAKKFINI